MQIEVYRNDPEEPMKHRERWLFWVYDDFMLLDEYSRDVRPTGKGPWKRQATWKRIGRPGREYDLESYEAPDDMVKREALEIFCQRVQYRGNDRNNEGTLIYG